MSCLKNLDLSKTNFNHLPSLASLTNLETLNLSKTPLQKVPDLSHLKNLKDFMPPEGEITCTGIHSSETVNCQEKVSSTRSELHIISTVFGYSRFDQFRDEFQKLEHLISDIEKSIQPRESRLRNTRADLKHILEKTDLLEHSRDCSSSEELLLELVNVADNLSVDDFLHSDSKNLIELVRVVAKLKLLSPPPPTKDDAENSNNDEEEKKKKKKTKSRFTTLKRDEEEEEVVSDYEEDVLEMECSDIHRHFESLTDFQRNCLLYFAAIPLSYGCLNLKDWVLIQLWYGEGFIGPSTYTNTNPKVCTTNQFSSEVSSIKEMGLHVPEDLHEKKFIEASRRISHWHLKDEVRSFVKARAKELRFFSFNESSGNLTPQLSGSERVCLLKSQDNYPSSFMFWLSQGNSVEQLESLKKIRTLLYVDEDLVDIKVEWFSKMKNLIVLDLGSFCWNDEKEVDVVDWKFLEGLKNMKPLRLLSLEGFRTLRKLPDSVWKLSNLRILNLGFCTNLEELPAGIGSLQNLTHLDLTQCHLLYELPKGIRLLSKLEVLKGFAVTYMVGGQQHTKACALRELLKLKKLRKLSLVVNKDKFPMSEDVQVFKQMKNLKNLKITWTQHYGEDQEETNDQKAVRHSRWQQLKFWKQQTSQSDIELSLSNHNLEHLKKLFLCGFPCWSRFSMGSRGP